MNKSDSIQNLAAALAKAQAAMPRIAFDATNPFLKNRYASLGAVIEASRPFLAQNSLCIVQLPITQGPEIGLETMLLHATGEWISERVLLPLGEEKGKSRAQVAGSVITYLRRYSWASILGLYADEDSDGNTPEPAKTAAKSEPVAQPKPAETEYDKRQRFIADCIKAGGNNPSYAKDFFIEEGTLLSTEDLKDYPVNKVPQTQKEAQNIYDEIAARAGAGNPPDPSEHKDTRPSVTGILEDVKVTSGKSAKTGKPWTRYALKLNGEYYSSFDKKLGVAAQAAQGQQVTVIYEEGERGNDAQEIIIEGIRYPEKES